MASKKIDPKPKKRKVRKSVEGTKTGIISSRSTNCLIGKLKNSSMAHKPQK